MMTRSAATIALGLVVLAGPQLPAAATTVTISLKGPQETAKTQMHVRDLALVRAESDILRSRVEDVEIGAAPRAGYRDSFTRSAIAKVIESRIPEARGALRWTGHEVAVVSRATQARDGTTLADTARAFLIGQLGARYVRLKITPVGHSARMALPSGSVELLPRADLRDSLPRIVCVWVDIKVNGELYASIPSWLAVEGWQQVHVAARRVERGHRLVAGDLRPELRDVAGLRATPVNALPQDRAVRVGRPMAAGTIVTSADIEPAPAVIRSQEVLVRVAGGAILVEAPGIALLDAHAGEQVQVRNAATRQQFAATVTGEGVVAVEVK